jgi:predicted regulator of Ras-like GTPase activity (Roadblock/LC7/MglB family)
MSARKRIAALGGLSGVQEASLLNRDGSVIVSSVDAPSLSRAASSLGSALQALQRALPDLGAPMNLTLESENGALHVAQAGDALIMLTTTREANLGAVRLELREAADELRAEHAG